MGFPQLDPGHVFCRVDIRIAIGTVHWLDQEFPSWSYPYAGHVFLFSLYMTNVSTPGFLFNREPWGWRAWIPFLVIALIALAVTRSLGPTVIFFMNIRDDWTLLTFGMFSFMPLLVAIGFDEVDRLYSLYFMITLALLMSGTAWFFLSSESQKRRIIILFIGITLTTAITIFAPYIYWEKNDWVFPVQMVIVGVVFELLMFSPSLIRLFHRTGRDIQRI